MNVKTIRFGVIGCGLMGREFASAVARWCHLVDPAARPELVAVCNRRPGPMEWFQQHFPSVQQCTTDYRELLANASVDGVYVAVPHHLHQEIYGAAIAAGKVLMAEKPVGIDRSAFEAIEEARRRHPSVFIRCASQWMFYPGAQKIGALIDRGVMGRILEVNAGFLHSSDLDPAKPINWKRVVATNGEYGVMGDLGMHVCSLPFRAGWVPQNVRAVLSNIVPERPDGQGGRAPCETWDNATLLCETVDPATGNSFPMTLKMQRIAPGQRNTWYVEVLGSRTSARFSTRNPKQLEILEYTGGDQVWGQTETGHDTAFKTITGPIFEFGFSDAVLQMWAAFLHEWGHGRPPSRFAGCVTAAEVSLSHRLFTAALASHRRGSVEGI